MGALAARDEEGGDHACEAVGERSSLVVDPGEGDGHDTESGCAVDYDAPDPLTAVAVGRGPRPRHGRVRFWRCRRRGTGPGRGPRRRHRARRCRSRGRTTRLRRRRGRSRLGNGRPGRVRRRFRGEPGQGRSQLHRVGRRRRILERSADGLHEVVGSGVVDGPGAGVEPGQLPGERIVGVDGEVETDVGSAGRDPQIGELEATPTARLDDAGGSPCFVAADGGVGGDRQDGTVARSIRAVPQTVSTNRCAISTSTISAPSQLGQRTTMPGHRR